MNLQVVKEIKEEDDYYTLILYTIEICFTALLTCIVIYEILVNGLKESLFSKGGFFDAFIVLVR